MRLARTILIWAVLASAIAVPIAAAALSPLLAWRDSIYIAAGFAGVIALGLLLVQPLLIGGYLPGLPAHRGRRVHRWIGAMLVVAVVIHVGGLWITSPPDVIDALLFVSPTPFSAWGVIAMWAIVAIALLVSFRRRLRLRPRNLAPRSQVLGGGDRRWNRGPRRADRGDDGDGVKGGPVRTRPCSDCESHGRPGSVEKANDVACSHTRSGLISPSLGIEVIGDTIPYLSGACLSVPLEHFHSRFTRLPPAPPPDLPNARDPMGGRAVERAGST